MEGPTRSPCLYTTAGASGLSLGNEAGLESGTEIPAGDEQSRGIALVPSRVERQLFSFGIVRPPSQPRG